MLIVAYKINDTLVANYEREGGDGMTCSGVILIFLTVVITCGNLTFGVYQYIWYKDCGYNNAIITITLFFGLSFYILVLLRTREDASVLTSSIVVAYLLYLQWSALASNPNEECNPFTDSASNTTSQLITGIFVTFLSLSIMSASSKSEKENNLTAQVSG